MRRLTVVQLLPALDAGGVERSTLEITAALHAAGHRALVVSAGGRLLPQLLAAGGEHLPYAIGEKSLLVFRHVPALRRLFAQADIVHARSRVPAWLAWWALRGMPDTQRPHFLTTVHGLNSPSRYSAIMTRGERVICVSETVKHYVQRHYPQVDAARLQVIPRGIDPAMFPHAAYPDAAARKRMQQIEPRLSSVLPLLLLPGRGTRLKGHTDAIHLVAGLQQAGHPVQLWMPGVVQQGRERYLHELQQCAEQLGVAQAVVMSPSIAAIADAYAASDGVLQLSRKPEAFGRTVIEALSVGRPVVGWAHGGVGELLRELFPAGAVPAFDEAALLETVKGLVSKPVSPSLDMPYTLQRMQEQTLALYESVVQS